MKLTLSNIKELKRKSDSPLTKRVCNYVITRRQLLYFLEKACAIDRLHFL